MLELRRAMLGPLRCPSQTGAFLFAVYFSPSSKPSTGADPEGSRETMSSPSARFCLYARRRVRLALGVGEERRATARAFRAAPRPGCPSLCVLSLGQARES